MNANWLQMLTQLIEDYQDDDSAEAKAALKRWNHERDQLRLCLACHPLHFSNKLKCNSNFFHFRNATKCVFNKQFGSVFRTYHNPTYFSRRLFRFSDIYTSNIATRVHFIFHVDSLVDSHMLWTNGFDKRFHSMTTIKMHYRSA